MVGPAGGNWEIISLFAQKSPFRSVFHSSDLHPGRYAHQRIKTHTHLCSSQGDADTCPLWELYKRATTVSSINTSREVDLTSSRGKGSKVAKPFSKASNSQASLVLMCFFIR